MTPAAVSLEKRLVRAATDLGFDVCKITSASLPRESGDNLQSYVANGYHGSMDWMKDTLTRRENPHQLWREARSVIVLAMNYAPSTDPLDDLEKKDCGLISAYARNRDYHDVIKGRLKTLAGKLVSWHDCKVKVFVDTAPVMEKPLASQAGIGWQGKHTNLVSRQFGSWLFLGSIFTDVELVADTGEEDHCGSCRSCLDICPTDAFPAPYRIDARRCISYLTIENKGQIPVEFRAAMGNRIYGCDDCLAVCPWNKFAVGAREMKLVQRDEMHLPELGFLLKLDDKKFRKFFSGSPVKRIGRDRFMRNVLIAVGNSAEYKYVAVLQNHLADPVDIVRGAAIWALRRLASAEEIMQARGIHFDKEPDKYVKAEWDIEIDA